MKKNILILLSFFIAFGAFSPTLTKIHAASFDATGTWLIETLAGETIMGLPIPVASGFADIDADTSTGTFSFLSDPIHVTGLGALVFSGTGSITNNVYTFDVPLTQDVNPHDVDPSFPSFDLQVKLDSFTLTAPDALVGTFDISFAGSADTLANLAFQGTLQPVPVPGSFWLLGIALIISAGMLRRERVRTPSSGDMRFSQTMLPSPGRIKH